MAVQVWRKNIQEIKLKWFQIRLLQRVLATNIMLYKIYILKRQKDTRNEIEMVLDQISAQGFSNQYYDK